MPRDEVYKEIREHLRASRTNKNLKPLVGVTFVNLDAVRNVLTEKRMEILHVVREKQPKSIYRLAKLTKRNFRNVYDDVQTLKYFGLIKMGKHKSSGKSKKSKRLAQSLSVPYQAINIHAGI